MHRLRAELPQPSATSPALTTGSIDSMVVIDRQVDLVTPMCTQLTYEGLIDEVIGIKNCKSLFHPYRRNGHKSTRELKRNPGYSYSPRRSGPVPLEPGPDGVHLEPGTG